MEFEVKDGWKVVSRYRDRYFSVMVSGPLNIEYTVGSWVYALNGPLFVFDGISWAEYFCSDSGDVFASVVKISYVPCKPRCVFGLRLSTLTLDKAEHYWTNPDSIHDEADLIDTPSHTRFAYAVYLGINPPPPDYEKIRALKQKYGA